jgi:MFS family permease
MKEAVKFLVNQKQLRSCFGVLFFLWGALGAVYVVSIVFIQKAFASATKEVGLLVVGLGAGLLVGSLSYGRLGKKSDGFRTIFACIMGTGVVLLTFVISVLKAPNLLIALTIAFFLGLVVSPIMVISNTLVQQLTDTSMRGKVFSSLEIVVHFAFLLSMMVSAPLADRIGSGNILLGVSGLLVVVGLIGFIRHHDQNRRTQAAY